MASPLTATLTMFGIQVGFPLAGILLGDKLLKSQKDKKIRYGLGITAFAFGGWLLSSHFTMKYLEDVEITLDAEYQKTDDDRILAIHNGNGKRVGTVAIEDVRDNNSKVYISIDGYNEEDELGIHPFIVDAVIPQKDHY